MTENSGNASSSESEVGFLLSSQQERLWGLFGEAMPCAQCVLAISGAPDAERLRGALEEAVERHEILRTAFVRPAGLRAPLQVVQDHGSLSWSTAEVRGLSEDEQRRRVAERQRDHAREPIDLEHGPLLGALLIATDSDQLLILTAPSIVLDVRSLELLAREALGSACEEEPLQYGDYVAWQQEQREATEETEAAGEECPLTALPLAGHPSAPAPEEMIEVQVPVSADAAAHIEQLSADRKDGWLALWSLLLARLTGQARLTIDVWSDGRAQAELADALGPFARPVPVTVEIEQNASLQELASAVGRERVSTEEALERHVPKAAAATTMGFSLTPELDSFELEGAEARVLTHSCRDDLLQARLEVRPGADAVKLALQFHPQAVSPTEAERIAGHLERLISSAAEQGGPTAVERLEILSGEQRATLLAELSAAGSTAPDAQLVHWRFEDTAARAPDAPAVALGEEMLTYAELNERANRLAHALHARGVGPGTTVSILLDRSPELIIAVLAVMKAAGAYLPLNPDHPTERLAFQMRDAGSSLVLTGQALAGAAAEMCATTESGASVLRVDEHLPEQPAENPERRGEAHDVAYVIYTSGSTGVPKGVEVTYGGLASYVAAMIDRLALEDSEPLRFGVVTTMSTDLGNTSVFGALACGGCLELVPVEAAMDGEAFAAHVADRPLDVLKITPSHLAALLASTERGALPRRWLILGGEAAPWSLIEQVRSLGSCAIINHYGPTETTIGSLTYDVNGRDGAAGPARTVPLGRPLAGTEIYVVDEHLRPVPIGAPGELLIGGAGLARGYLGQPEQTAERFIAHPFSSEPAARVYRTGDVVRFLADGSVEFLGRADDQVKIRGFRVELGEIETVLRSHPGVSQVAVAMREESPGDRRLVAYVVGDGAAEDLRALARRRLPDYMTPSAFVRLDVLPLTPNGKLDRAALPAPDTAGASTREYVAPSTEIEERLVAIWAQALGIERVGVQDDFFELGGHSLLATQVIARIRSAYDVQLPLHSLFTSPRVAELALEVAAAREPPAQDDVELSALLEDLEGLSDEEAERLLGLEASASEEQPAAGSG